MAAFCNPFDPDVKLYPGGCGHHPDRHAHLAQHRLAGERGGGDEPFSVLDALTRRVLQEEVLRICAETQQTLSMITHDVDEACLLADQVAFKTRGPNARIAELVENTIAKPRSRETIHHDPQFYRLRNHPVDFLAHRSRQSVSGKALEFDARPPPLVRPGLETIASEA